MILQDIKVQLVGTAKSMGRHCRYCISCQIANAQANKPAPFQPFILS